MQRIFATLALAVLAVAPAAYAQATAVGSVTIGAEAGLTVPATPLFTLTGGPFSAFIATTNLTYFIRTSQAGGSGNIQVKVATDYTPAGGPSAAAANLKYACTASNPGNNGTATGCTGAVTASTTAQTPVTSFGPDARSSLAGNSVSIQWSLKDDPSYKASSYTATVTFTISAN